MQIYQLDTNNLLVPQKSVRPASIPATLMTPLDAMNVMQEESFHINTNHIDTHQML